MAESHRRVASGAGTQHCGRGAGHMRARTEGPQACRRIAGLSDAQIADLDSCEAETAMRTFRWRFSLLPNREMRSGSDVQCEADRGRTVLTGAHRFTLSAHSWSSLPALAAQTTAHALFPVDLSSRPRRPHNKGDNRS